MKNKKSEPVLIHFDQGEFDKHLHLINNRLIPVLNKIKKEFLKLEIGSFNQEILNDILFGGFKLIKEKMFGEVNDGSPSRFLKGQAMNEASKMLDRLFTACDELKQIGNIEFQVVIDLPSVDEDGNITMTEEAKESLRELHSTYCITEKGLELLEAHKAAAESLNKFYQLAKANLSDNPMDLGELFDFDREGNIIRSIQQYDHYEYAKQGKILAGFR